MSDDTKLRKDVKDDSLAARMRDYRQRFGLTRKEAGEAWGLSWRTIECWEQERSEPTGLYRERLEEVLRD